MDEAEQPSDEALFEAARSDETALTALYRRHARGVLGNLVAAIARSGDGGGRLLGGVAALVERILGSGGAPGSVSGWLYGVARHKVVDAQRRGGAETRARRKLGIGRLELSDEGIERILELGDDVRASVAMDELPPAQRSAIEARILREEDYATIARASGTSAANVRQRVVRGLARLRSVIEDQR